MSRKKSTVEQVQPDLEIEEHLRQQEQGWKVQVAGLAFIFAMIVAAAIGLFGDGLLSQKSQKENLTTVEYERFYRFEAAMELKINVEDGDEEDVIVSFPMHYLQNFEIESILPEPDQNVIQNNEVQYSFKGAGGRAMIFYLKPRKAGSIDGTLKVNTDPFPLSHFIFP